MFGVPAWAGLGASPLSPNAPAPARQERLVSRGAHPLGEAAGEYGADRILSPSVIHAVGARQCMVAGGRVRTSARLRATGPPPARTMCKRAWGRAEAARRGSAILRP